jgi:hypothetical protein
MSLWDAVGFLASGLVIAAFCMRDLIALRGVALASKCAFIAYGIGLNLTPVWLLHGVLLPVNCCRLWQGGRACGTGTRSGTASPERHSRTF